MYLKVILFIISVQVFYVDLLPQKRFLDLKGIDDSIDITHLFYRILDNDFYCARFDILKFNTLTSEQEDLYSDASCFFPEGYSYTYIYDYIFYNKSSYLSLSCGDYRGNFSHEVLYSFITNINRIRFEWPYDNKITDLEISKQNNSYLYASMSVNPNNYGVLISTDGGFNWDTLSLGSYLFRSLSSLNDSLFFSSSDQGTLYKSTNGGADYHLVDNNNLIDWRIEWYGNLRYAGHFKFLYDTDGQYIYTVATNADLNKYYFIISQDEGENWQIRDSSSESYPIYIDIDKSQSGAVYKCINTTIYYSNDFAETFSIFKQIETDYNIRGIYKKPGTDVVYIITAFILYEVDSQNIIPLLTLTDVKDDGKLTIPSDFNISQNYPNPFNPSTIIKFTILDLRLTTLKVYDVLGNEIATLVNEEKPAGEYEIEFNGTGLPSGIYFYQLRTGDYIKTKKMVLLK